MKTPFSGLSLLIHAAVIGLATLAVLIVGERRVASSKRALSLRGTICSQQQMLTAISISIVASSGFFMLLALVIAIQTGVREAQKESHMIFLVEESDILFESSKRAFTNIFATEAATFPDLPVERLPQRASE